MKSSGCLCLFFIVAVILFFTVSGSSRIVPYGADLMQTNHYENFGNPKYGPLEYNETSGARMPASTAGECKKVAGFQGVYCPANQEGAMKPNEVFSQASGSPDCQSMGYSNSRGFLCMNAEQKRLLTTRGGNASGVV